MRWNEINTQTCSIARSMSVFGDRWTVLILREIFKRIRRFSDMQRSLGIAKHRLSDRLNRLVDDGILYKDLYDESRNRYEYKLTGKGLDLYPIIVAIAQWGDKWEADEDGTPVEYTHKDCGQIANPRLCCSDCGGEIHARNTSAGLGPGILRKLERGKYSDIDIGRYSKALRANKS